MKAAVNITRFTRAVVAICLAILCSNIATSQPEQADVSHHLIVPLTPFVGVVSGDPTKPGAPFVLRIANRANQIVPVHWHPEDEHITVVQGHLVPRKW